MRLTRKNNSGNYTFAFNTKQDEKAIKNKLGQLEDLMDKYNINSVEELERTILNDGTGEQAFKEYIEVNMNPYKDTERDLGIDLITLFKAIENGFYYELEYEDEYEEDFFKLNMTSMQIDFNEKAFAIEHQIYIYFKDYGKTWALTKEELK